MSLRDHFREFVRYNAWANARLYAAAFALDGEQRRRDIGLFFRSIHGTLNHLLVTDRIWLFRLTGTDREDGPLDNILYDDDDALIRARIDQDRRLGEVIERYDADAFAGNVTYANMSGERFEQPLSLILTHLFNHQTHHRGQAHTGLSQLTGREPPSFDYIAFARGVPAPDMARQRRIVVGGPEACR